ncbi:efflux RND transporter periplasmic adaptor subunit [Candidatus Parcubacteria bacterium]|nr:efflux RND transporter periplasmic adaptor subunit [Candidatus Parcubacteria bacterium]
MWNFINMLIREEIWFERFARKHVLGALAGAILLGLGAGYFLRGGPEAEEVVAESRIREVKVASVAELSGTATTLPLVGTVTSESEASISAQSSGEVRAIYKKLGDFVAAGSIIAEIENSRERATVLQAQAGVESAKAGKAISESGASISETSSESAKRALEEARVAAVNSLRSAYDAADDSVRSKLDLMFSNARTQNPQFNITVSDSQLPIDINFKRLNITDILARETARKASLSVTSDLAKEISLAEADLRYIKDFNDDVILALNQGIASQSVSQATIDSFRTSAAATRSTLNAAISSLSSVRDNLSIKASQLEVSSQQTGSSGSSVSSSEAVIKQAEATLRLAQVSLEKSFIRAPISGTLNSFSLKRGDFVSLSQPVAVISNNNALEVVSYITEEDAAYVAVGSKATIGESVAGVVTRIAPALDPKTRKIEVRIGITGSSSLINGQTVSLSLIRAPKTRNVSQNAPLTVPISALKITPAGSFVFTIGAEGKLVAHQVKEGLLLGDRVAISEGLTSDMHIVTDARGLKEGMSVTVKAE